MAAGVPVVISYYWNEGDLTGAPIPSSDGHLAVLVGFDAAGNPIVNDPAAATDADVQRTYLRSELEHLWVKKSGGTAYAHLPDRLRRALGPRHCLRSRLALVSVARHVRHLTNPQGTATP